MISIENKYLIVVVLLLFISYVSLKYVKKNISYVTNKLTVDNGKNKKIVTLINNKIIENIDSNIFDTYIKSIKKNIVNLSYNIPPNECDKLKKYLDLSKKSITDSIDELNKTECSEYITKTIDIDLLNMRNDLESKLNVNDDDNYINNTKSNIIDLLIDMELLTSLMKNSKCKKHKIDITWVDSFIKQLYDKKCNNEQFTNEVYLAPEISIYENISKLKPISLKHDKYMSDSKTKILRETELDKSIADSSYMNRASPYKYLPIETSSRVSIFK